MYINDYTKDGNADKALRKEFITPKNLFIVEANNINIRNSDFDTAMDAILSGEEEQCKLVLIDPNSVIQGTAVLKVIGIDGTSRSIKCLKGLRMRTVLNENGLGLQVQGPNANNCGGGGICGTCMVNVFCQRRRPPGIQRCWCSKSAVRLLLRCTPCTLP